MSRHVLVSLLFACAGCEGLFGADFDATPRAGDDGGGGADGSIDDGRGDRDGDGDIDSDGGGNVDDGSSKGEGCVGACEGALVTGLKGVGALAVDDANVYFSALDPKEGGAIYTCAKSGCAGAPKRMAKGFRPESDQRVFTSIAYDANRIYWFGRSQEDDDWLLYACAKGGCFETPSKIVSDPAIGAIGPVVAANGWLVWRGYQHVVACTSATCTNENVKTLANTGSSSNTPIAIEGDVVVWMDSFNVISKSLTTMKSSYSLGQSHPEGGVALHDGVAFFTDAANNVVSCPLTGCTDTATNQPKPKVVGASPKPECPAVDDAHIYWNDPVAKSIYRCKLPDCTASGPDVFVSDVEISAPVIALDDAYVYWTTDSGVFRKKK